uniref:cupin domain-containing protein n=1 Tax=Sphingobium sp. TaxID=1912891 RepID=UPI0035C70FDC
MNGRDESVAKRLIEALDLSPHPEGGWYRETWRAPAVPEQRAGGTAIYFLLEVHQHSHWHSVDADEHWLWHAGAPLMLSMAREGKAVKDRLLGADVL